MHDVRLCRCVFAAAIALAGCGGSGARTDNVTPPGAAASSKPAETTRVNFTIILPTKHTSALRRTAYVSASTQSAAITATPSGGSGVTTVIGCNTTACSGTVSAAIGSDTFAVTLYDGANGTGNALSTVSATQTIAVGQANSVSLTCNGVAASLAVSLSASGTAGTSASIPLTVSALDADGNTIVGAGNYVTSNGAPVTITLSNSDTSGATTPSRTSFTAPSSGVTLSYSGLAINPATLTVSASGYTNATTTFSPTLQPIVVTTSDTLNPSFAGIDLYAVSGTGSSGSVTASEAGWTNSPYNQSLTITPGGSCGTIGTVTPSGDTVSVTAVASPSSGTCTAATVSDPFSQNQPITLVYSAFASTGTVQSLTLPTGVTSAVITTVGAGGG